MTSKNRERALDWIFRVAIAMCFIGHGAFGIIGMADIGFGIAVLVRPMRSALVYMTAWALWTAALRPLSGASVFELLERAGNYGVPLAFLIYLGLTRPARDWFARAIAPPLTAERETALWRILAATTALLLIGHAGLALEGKPALVQHAGIIGMSSSGVAIVGAIEIGLAALVLVIPHPVLFACIAR